MESTRAPWIAGTAAPVLDTPPEVELERTSKRRPRLYVLPTAPSARSAEPAPTPRHVEEAHPDFTRAASRRPSSPRRTARNASLRPESKQEVALAPDALLMFVIRFLGAVLVVLALIATGLVVGKALAPAPSSAITVMPGDTLFSIAANVEDAPSIGTAIEDIKNLNVLGSERLAVGQKLILPEY